MQLKFFKFNKHNRSYDLFCNTFKCFYITKDRQAIVFLDTFLLHCRLTMQRMIRSTYTWVIRTLHLPERNKLKQPGHQMWKEMKTIQEVMPEQIFKQITTKSEKITPDLLQYVVIIKLENVTKMKTVAYGHRWLWWWFSWMSITSFVLRRNSLRNRECFDMDCTLAHLGLSKRIWQNRPT